MGVGRRLRTDAPFNWPVTVDLILDAKFLSAAGIAILGGNLQKLPDRATLPLQHRVKRSCSRSHSHDSLHRAIAALSVDAAIAQTPSRDSLD
jgi:hypothetical protein